MLNRFTVLLKIICFEKYFERIIISIMIIISTSMNEFVYTMIITKGSYYIMD